MRAILLLLILSFSFGLTQAQLKIPNISDNDKILGLSMFWKEASYNFVYFDNVPKLNWDSAYSSFIPKVLATKNLYEYSRVLKQFSALLKDGHTNVSYYSVDTLNYQRSFGKYKIDLQEFDNKVYVINTALKTKDEIQVGSELLSINNIPTEKYLTDSILPYICSSANYIRREYAVSKLLSGLKGTNVEIEIKSPDGKKQKFKLQREFSDEKWLFEPEKRELVDFKFINNQIAYVAINSFMDQKVDSLFKSLIPELLKCKALIIDIRENGGGNSSYAEEIIKTLTDKPFFFGELGSTRKLLSSHKAWGASYEKILSQINLDTASAEFKHYETNPDFIKMYNSYKHYKGIEMEVEKVDTIFNNDKSPKLLMPIAVLIGHNTASAAEDFLVELDYLKRATFIGQKTYGSTGQPYSFNLPGGGYARVCTRKCTYPDGRKFVGIGIKPDIEITPTLNNYLNKDDVILKKAIEYLESIEK